MGATLAAAEDHVTARAPSHNRPAIGLTLIVLGLLGAIQGWPHMGIPVGVGTGLIVGALIFRRRR